MKYAEVILPLSLDNSYTYRIPADLEQQVTPFLEMDCLLLHLQVGGCL